MLFTLRELFDLTVMTFALGFIFRGVFYRKYRDVDDYLKLLQKKRAKWDDFVFSLLISAPAIILHEMSHKFVALLMGIPATFYASYPWLGLGVFLRLINFNFIFFVPGYVSIANIGTPFMHAGIAFAGPAMNGLLWLFAFVALKKNWAKNDSQRHILVMTQKINLFLFFFNLLPLPPFDGWSVLNGIVDGFAK